jgi:monoamine oxidase
VYHPHAGFIAGERADAICKMASEEPIQRFLAQLDTIFGTTSNPKPASACFVSGTVFDWSQEEYVGGAYTYPTLGAEPGDREALQAPVQGTLFFAGEACHAGVNPCMQAALETGELAAEQARAALQPVFSRL